MTLQSQTLANRVIRVIFSRTILGPVGTSPPSLGLPYADRFSGAFATYTALLPSHSLVPILCVGDAILRCLPHHEAVTERSGGRAGARGCS